MSGGWIYKKKETERNISCETPKETENKDGEGRRCRRISDGGERGGYDLQQRPNFIVQRERGIKYR